MTCIPLERLRRFRRQQLPEDERELVERHLSECRSCRRRLVDDLRREEAAGPEEVPDEILLRVRRLVPAAGRGRRSAPRLWMPLAAVVVALAGAWLLLPRPGPDTVLRDVEPVSESPSPIEPAASAEVEGGIQFRWTSVPEASLYRLVILGADGGRIAERETVATEIEIDVDDLAGEAASVEAFWLVEAQLPGGGRLYSEPRPIRLRFSTGSSP